MEFFDEVSGNQTCGITGDEDGPLVAVKPAPPVPKKVSKNLTYAIEGDTVGPLVEVFDFAAEFTVRYNAIKQWYEEPTDTPRENALRRMSVALRDWYAELQAEQDDLYDLGDDLPF